MYTIGPFFRKNSKNNLASQTSWQQTSSIIFWAELLSTTSQTFCAKQRTFFYLTLWFSTTRKKYHIQLISLYSLSLVVYVMSDEEWKHKRYGKKHIQKSCFYQCSAKNISWTDAKKNSNIFSVRILAKSAHDHWVSGPLFTQRTVSNVLTYEKPITNNCAFYCSKNNSYPIQISNIISIASTPLKPRSANNCWCFCTSIWVRKKIFNCKFGNII